MIGKASPNRTHRFSGLFVCGECGSGMGTYSRYQHRGRPVQQLGLRCNMMYQKPRNEVFCHQKGYVPYREIQAYLDARLRELLDGTSPDIFEDEVAPSVEAQRRVAAAQAELSELEARIGKLIYEQSAAPEAAQSYYRKQIGELSGRTEILRAQLAQLERKAASATHESVLQAATVTELRALTLAAFWQQPDKYINQMLHRLFGSRQLVILDRHIVGVTERRRQRRRRQQR